MQTRFEAFLCPAACVCMLAASGERDTFVLLGYGKRPQGLPEVPCLTLERRHTAEALYSKQERGGVGYERV
jgi:hypothetical protein